MKTYTFITRVSLFTSNNIYIGFSNGLLSTKEFNKLNQLTFIVKLQCIQIINKHDNIINDPIMYHRSIKLKKEIKLKEKEIELKKKEIELEKLNIELQSIKSLKNKNKNKNIGIKRKIQFECKNNDQFKEPLSKKRKIVRLTKQIEDM